MLIFGVVRGGVFGGFIRDSCEDGSRIGKTIELSPHKRRVFNLVHLESFSLLETTFNLLSHISNSIFISTDLNACRASKLGAPNVLLLHLINNPFW
jgi:hypothetical protein